MIKSLSRRLFALIAACLASGAVAQQPALTELYWGCTQHGFNENWVCTNWAPTVGVAPAYPQYGFESLGFIFPPDPQTQPPGTQPLYYGCMAQGWNGSEMACVRRAVTMSPPPYGSTTLGYIHPTTPQVGGTVPIYYGCTQQGWNEEWVCTTYALTKTQPAYANETLGRVYKSNDSCSRTGLTMCLLFEDGTNTQFAPNTVTTRNMDGTSSASNLPWEVQNAAAPNTPTPNERIGLVSVARDFSSGIRFQTLNNDRGINDSQDLERSELELTAENTGAEAGAETWWAHSLFVPSYSNLPSETGKQAGVFQFHGTPVPGDSTRNQPNFILQIYNQEGADPGQQGPAPHAVFRAYSAGANGVLSDNTQYTYKITGGPTRIGQCIYNSVEKEVWYDFVHRIRWSYSGTGSHEIWMRKGNEPVRKVLQKTGISTLYSNDRAYLKIGLYHDPMLGVNTSVIHDRIRRGSTAEAVRMPDFTVDLNASVVLCPDTTPN